MLKSNTISGTKIYYSLSQLEQRNQNALFPTRDCYQANIQKNQPKATFNRNRNSQIRVFRVERDMKLISLTIVTLGANGQLIPGRGRHIVFSDV